MIETPTKPTLEQLRQDLAEGIQELELLQAELDTVIDDEASSLEVKNAAYAAIRERRRQNLDLEGRIKHLESQPAAASEPVSSTLAETLARKVRTVKLPSGKDSHRLRWGESKVICGYRAPYTSKWKDVEGDPPATCEDCTRLEAMGERWDVTPAFQALAPAQKKERLRACILERLAQGPETWHNLSALAPSVPGLVNTVIRELEQSGVVTRDEKWLLGLTELIGDAPAADLTPAGETDVLSAPASGNVSTDPDPNPAPAAKPAKSKREKKPKAEAIQLRTPAPAELEEAILVILSRFPKFMTVGSLILNLQGAPWAFQLDEPTLLARLDLMIADELLDSYLSNGRTFYKLAAEVPADPAPPAADPPLFTGETPASLEAVNQVENDVSEQLEEAAQDLADTPSPRPACWWDQILDGEDLTDDRVARRLADPEQAREFIAYVAEHRPDDIATALDEVIDFCPELAGEAFSMHAHLLEAETAELMSARIERLPLAKPDQAKPITSVIAGPAPAPEPRIHICWEETTVDWCGPMPGSTRAPGPGIDPLIESENAEIPVEELTRPSLLPLAMVDWRCIYCKELGRGSEIRMKVGSATEEEIKLICSKTKQHTAEIDRVGLNWNHKDKVGAGYGGGNGGPLADMVLYHYRDFGDLPEGLDRASAVRLAYDIMIDRRRREIANPDESSLKPETNAELLEDDIAARLVFENSLIAPTPAAVAGPASESTTDLKRPKSSSHLTPHTGRWHPIVLDDFAPGWSGVWHGTYGTFYLIAPGHSWQGNPDRWCILIGTRYQYPGGAFQRITRWLNGPEGQAVSATLAA